ncbi:MAG TPA: NHL repeat-containing protein [Verrucomicrobiae bacterium]|nr:NHL repeat-containing protein [Verrucomicrobiae bacterium]
MRAVARIAAGALAIALSSCAAPQSALSPAGAPASAGFAAARQGVVRMRILVPAAPRTPKFVSPSTQSLVYVVSQEGTPVEGGSGYANLTPSSPECADTAQGLVCTVDIPVAVLASGLYDFALAMYDQEQHGSTTTAPCTPPSTSGCSGSLLSQSIAPAVLEAGRLNNLTFTLGGIPQSLVVLPLSRSYLRREPHSALDLRLWGERPEEFAVQALDADGNAIIGSGAPRYGVTSAASSKLIVTPPPSTLSNVFTMQAVTTGQPPVVQPGVVALTYTATPSRQSQAVPLVEQGRVTIAHRILYATLSPSAARTLAFYDGNTTPSASIVLRPGQLSAATGVAVEPESDLVYVADPTEVALCRPRSTNYSCTANVAKLRLPLGIAIGRSDVLYVVEHGLLVSEVLRCPPAGAALRSCSRLLRGNHPFAAAVGADGTLYVTDSSRNVVTECPANASRARDCTSVGTVRHPTGIAVDDKGMVYVASARDGTVTRCERDGRCKTLLYGLRRPGGIAVDGAGTLYVADTGAHTVLTCPFGGACRPGIYTGLFTPPAFVAAVPSALEK